MATPVQNAAEPGSEGLRRGAVGFTGVLFQSITFMAPAIATALSIPAGIAFSGGAAPLSVIVALVACLIAANSIGQLSRHLPSAGSFYTFVSHGIHPQVGFLVAWGFLLGVIVGGPFLALQMGFIVADTLNAEWGWSTGTWWIWTVLVCLLVFALGYRGITTSTRTGVLLGAFEILVFVAISLTLIVQAGGDNTLQVFTTHYANNPDYSGWSGVIAGSVFTILAFIGFEQAAPIAEEAHEPRRTIPLAIIAACLAIGVFYILNTYASSIAYGPARMTGFVTAGDGNPWQNVLGRQAWGWIGFLLVFLALVNSVIANQNAANNSSTRTMFAMGRIRLLPPEFSRLNPFGSPLVALFAQLAVSIAVALYLGFHYDPYTGFVLTATILVDIFAPMYILLNIACLTYFLRFRRDEFNVVRHGLLPILGALAFIPAFFAGAGIPAFSFISSLPAPLSYAGPVAAIWMVIGLGYLVVLNIRTPQRIAETKLVFDEE
ncbi:MAG: APC family permease [Nocardioides sp.]|nr:APC family permease [Nocardioides sp.]